MAALFSRLIRRVSWPLGAVLFVLSLAAPTVNADLFDDLSKVFKEPDRPDLTVNSVSLDKRQASVGETVKATVQIANGGKARAKSTRLIVSAASATGTTQLASVDLGIMPGKTNLTYVSTFAVPNFAKGGTYRILASLTTSTNESRRSNNMKETTLQVIVPTPSNSVSSSAPVASISTPAASPATAAPADQSPCDYYASPNGTGDGLRSGSPFKISNFWAVATPGKTLCLMDGIYQGASSMIQPSAGLSGTNSSPITVRAMNEGAVLIDGQFATTPILINDNNWFVLEGFNAKSAGIGYQGVLTMTSGSNNIFRRLVLWDARFDTNITVISVDYAPGTNNLFEDIAAFGTGRKVMVGGSGTLGGTQTCRRCWFRWEGSRGVGATINLNYNSYGFTCENCLITWTGESMPESYTDELGIARTGSTPPEGHSGGLGRQRFQSTCTNARMLGSMAYVKSSTVAPFWPTPYQGWLFNASTSCVQFRHVFAYMSPSHPDFTRVMGFNLSTDPVDPSPTNITAYNITSVRSSSASSVGDFFARPWDIQNHSAGESLAAVANPWTATTTGANLCKRWVNGVVTNEPLWPWPMNQRIKDATASAGAYSGPCPNCIGGRRMRTATDVTADIEEMLGPIPSHCKTSP